MAFTYTIRNQHKLHFITLTVQHWIDVFTRNLYKDIIIESLKYCQNEKGLEIYAWVIMSNHIHLIVKSDTNELSNIIRDFKKYTAKQIVKNIIENPRESRKKWMKWLFIKDNKICFWRKGYHAKEIETQKYFENKLCYIHANPVKAGIVEREEDYIYSSASNYYGIRNGIIELKLD